MDKDKFYEATRLDNVSVRKFFVSEEILEAILDYLEISDDNGLETIGFGDMDSLREMVNEIGDTVEAIGEVGLWMAGFLADDALWTADRVEIVLEENAIFERTLRRIAEGQRTQYD